MRKTGKGAGEGTDLSSRSMWARVKGRTEAALLQLPLEAYMFRPGFIRPRRGKQSKTALYRIGYRVLAPAFPLLRRLAPRHVTTAENLGGAMVEVAARGYDRRVLENVDINRLGGGTGALDRRGNDGERAGL